MNVTINDLLDLLDEEAACYREMQRILADEETSMSLSGKGRFDQVRDEKEFLVARLKRLEEKRKALVGQLSETYPTDGQSMTISRLAQFVRQPARQHLLDRASRLRSLIGDVHEKNRRNQQMIDHYLDLIKGSLTLLTRLMEGSPVYRKPGSHHSPAGYQAGGGRVICGSI
jgi:flagellar biosynthesis/type III secretory pathway chaperone